MRYHLLGQTGLYVSELCLGTMTYGGYAGIWETIGNLQQDAVNEQVKFAPSTAAAISLIPPMCIPWASRKLCSARR